MNIFISILFLVIVYYNKFKYDLMNELDTLWQFVVDIIWSIDYL